MFAPTSIVPDAGSLSLMPLSWRYVLLPGLNSLGLIPPIPMGSNNGYALNPMVWAGWVGLVVTMLNLLPAAMLDGGHVARSLVPDKLRYILTVGAVATLVLAGSEFWVLAFV